MRRLAGTSFASVNMATFYFETSRNMAFLRFHAGDCDAGCSALAELLGWKDDLQALIDSKGQASVYRAPWVETSET